MSQGGLLEIGDYWAFGEVCLSDNLMLESWSLKRFFRESLYLKISDVDARLCTTEKKLLIIKLIHLSCSHEVCSSTSFSGYEAEGNHVLFYVVTWTLMSFI